jgi:hypothetical protein
MGIRVLFDSREGVAALYSSVTEQLFGRLIHPIDELGLDAEMVAKIILALDRSDFLFTNHSNRADVAFIDAACEEIKQLDMDTAWNLAWDVVEWSDEAVKRALGKARAFCGLP